MRRMILTVTTTVVTLAVFAPAATAGPVGEAACTAVMAARRAIGFYPMGSGSCPGGIEP